MTFQVPQSGGVRSSSSFCRMGPMHFRSSLGSSRLSTSRGAPDGCGHRRRLSHECAAGGGEVSGGGRGGSGEAGVVHGEGYLYPVVRVELGE